MIRRAKENNKNIVEIVKVAMSQVEIKTKNTTQLVMSKEVPKWLGQKFEIQKNEIERWAKNYKSSEKEKYGYVIEI